MASEVNQPKGYRGYIASRPVRGISYAQSVQNLVIRDYAAQRNLLYKLSATEYAMQHCHMMLESVVAELADLDGLIFFSLFMLPENRARRTKVYQAILNSGKSIHGALEGVVLKSAEDVSRFEEVFSIDRICSRTPPSELESTR